MNVDFDEYLTSRYVNTLMYLGIPIGTKYHELSQRVVSKLARIVEEKVRHGYKFRKGSSKPLTELYYQHITKAAQRYVRLYAKRPVIIRPDEVKLTTVGDI